MFKKFHLRAKLLEGIEKIGFKKPTEIQEKVIPLAIRRKNIIGVSATGSGKTHAFLIPVLQNIKQEYEAVQSIIITPTRELAVQIHKMANQLAKKSDIKLKINLCIGGENINKQIDSLKIQPHIVIGTPTRIHELYTRGNLLYTTCNIVVIDEADMTFDLGFFPIVDELLSKIRPTSQKLIFSATLTEQISHHMSKYIKNATIIRVGDLWVHKNIIHKIVPTKNDKEGTLFKILDNINPYMCMIFANSKKEVDEIYTKLLNKGMNVVALHGSLESRDRKNRFKEIRKLKYKYVVCSDIAARGVDIEGITHIINWNLPKDDEWYIHRSGRAGRGNLKGESIILFEDEDRKIIERLKNKGIEFQINKMTENGWKESTLSSSRKKPQITLADREINQLYKNSRKKNKVKPMYKKKLRTQASKIRKKHKRAVIEEQIKANLRQKWIDSSKKRKEQEIV